MSGLVTFSLAGETYAVPLDRVNEVIRRCRVTPLPGYPVHIRGMMNLRGAIIAVLDPRPLLGFPPGVKQEYSALLLKDGRPGVISMPVAFLVDEIGDILPAVDYRMLNVPANIPAELSKYIAGVAESGGEIITVLNTELILDVHSSHPALEVLSNETGS